MRCKHEPCENYGKCQSNSGLDFKCTCLPFYTGKYCEGLFVFLFLDILHKLR